VESEVWKLKGSIWGAWKPSRSTCGEQEDAEVIILGGSETAGCKDDSECNKWLGSHEEIILAGSVITGPDFTNIYNYLFQVTNKLDIREKDGDCANKKH